MLVNHFLQELRQRALRGGTRRRAGLAQHPPRALEVRRSEPAFARERVRRGGADREPVVAPRAHVEQRVGDRALDAADVERVVEHPGGDGVGVGHAQPDRHARMLADEGPQQLADAVVPDGVARADAQLAVQLTGALCAETAELRETLQQLLRERQQLAPARVQVQPAAVAVEGGRAELPLQLGERHARGGLRQVHRLGGRADRAKQRRLDEHLELSRGDVDHQRTLYIES